MENVDFMQTRGANVVEPECTTRKAYLVAAGF